MIRGSPVQLLLLATLALAGPDTAYTADSGYPLNSCGVHDDEWGGTWTGYGCQSSVSACGPDPCPTWDGIDALLAGYGPSYEPWTLDTCADGGHRAFSCCRYESSTTLDFDPTGELAASISNCTGLCAGVCCDGHYAKISYSGTPRGCDVVESRTWPAPPVPGSPLDVVASPAEDPPKAVEARPTGCGCDHAAAGSPWWLVALGALVRRRQAGSTVVAREASHPE